MVRDDSTIREEELEGREFQTNESMHQDEQELETEKPQFLWTKPEDLMIQEEETDTQEANESQRQSVKASYQHVVVLEDQKQPENPWVGRESALSKSSKPKISDLINKVIERLESEQIGLEEVPVATEIPEDIKFEAKSVSAGPIFDAERRVSALEVVEKEIKNEEVAEKEENAEREEKKVEKEEEVEVAEENQVRQEKEDKKIVSDEESNSSEGSESHKVVAEQENPISSRIDYELIGPHNTTISSISNSQVKIHV